MSGAQQLLRVRARPLAVATEEGGGMAFQRAALGRDRALAFAQIAVPGRGSETFSWLALLSCRACAGLASVSAPADSNRDDFDPTAEVEGRQYQTVLSMAATMRWVRLRAKGIAR
jgi:hypothetical protein